MYMNAEEFDNHAVQILDCWFEKKLCNGCNAPDLFFAKSTQGVFNMQRAWHSAITTLAYSYIALGLD